MTARARTMLVAMVAFLVGCVGGGAAGAYVAIHFTSTFFGDGFMLVKAVNTQTQVAILRHLRKGDADGAIELLEANLDGDVIGLGVDAKYLRSTNEAVQKAISLASDYRATYPSTTGVPERSAGTGNVLDPTSATPSRP